MERGTRLSSSFVVLMSTGDPISSSLGLELQRVLDGDRFMASFSFKTLKSTNTGVEGIRGEAEALRACRTTFGERKPWTGGYVADLGAQGEGRGMTCDCAPLVPSRGDALGLKGWAARGLDTYPSDCV